MAGHKTSTIHRATCVVALYELDQVGALNGLTLQQIADALGVGHRSTAMRYLRDVQAVKALLPEIRGKLEQLPRRQA